MHQLTISLARFTTISRGRETERGELLAYFCNTVNAERDGKKYRKIGIPYIAAKVQGIPTPDLYYMKSVMTDKVRRGQSGARWFFWSINSQKHETV